MYSLNLRDGEMWYVQKRSKASFSPLASRVARNAIPVAQDAVLVVSARRPKNC